MTNYYMHPYYVYLNRSVTVVAELKVTWLEYIILIDNIQNVFYH